MRFCADRAHELIQPPYPSGSSFSNGLRLGFGSSKTEWQDRSTLKGWTQGRLVRLAVRSFRATTLTIPTPGPRQVENRDVLYAPNARDETGTSTDLERHTTSQLGPRGRAVEDHARIGLLCPNGSKAASAQAALTTQSHLLFESRAPRAVETS